MRAHFSNCNSAKSVIVSICCASVFFFLNQPSNNFCPASSLQHCYSFFCRKLFLHFKWCCGGYHFFEGWPIILSYQMVSNDWTKGRLMNKWANCGSSLGFKTLGRRGWGKKRSSHCPLGLLNWEDSYLKLQPAQYLMISLGMTEKNEMAHTTRRERERQRERENEIIIWILGEGQIHFWSLRFSESIKLSHC